MVSRCDPEGLAREAQRAVLAGIALGDDLSDVVLAVAGTHGHGFTPDVALLELAADALEVAGRYRGPPGEL